MRTRILVAASVVSIAAVIPAANGLSATSMKAKAGDTPTIVVGTAAANVEQSFSQLYVAAQRGYFAKQGLNVQIVPFGAGLSAALATNQANLAYTSTGLAFALQNNGTPMEILYNALGGGSAAPVISSNPSITNPAQCKSMVSSAVGTTSYAWALVEQKLFHASYQITPASNSSVITPAVVSGQADCAVGAYTLLNPVVAANQAHYVFNPLAKNAKPKGWPSAASEAALYGTKAEIDSLGPAVMEKFLTALNQAYHDIKTDTAANLAASVHAYPGTQGTDQTTMAHNIQILKPLWAPNAGYISQSSWNQIRRFFRAAGFGYMTTTNANFKYPAIINMSYYDKAIGAPTPAKK
jgi:ABC-type nitrate/sulfonate/bicarbonate transport system substrate-binding protein